MSSKGIARRRIEYDRNRLRSARFNRERDLDQQQAVARRCTRDVVQQRLRRRELIVAHNNLPRHDIAPENLEAACEMAVSGDIAWDTQEMDSDNARKTTITSAKVIPDSLELVAGDIILRRERPATPGFGVPGYGLSGFLYENEAETGPLLEIPKRFTDDE